MSARARCLTHCLGTARSKRPKLPGKYVRSVPLSRSNVETFVQTKHFQTLFWSKQVRLVDCPGLVFPSFMDLEMQVLAGILPISQIPAIPSSTHHALQYLPLEDILALKHPEDKIGVPEDKRTWRAGMRPKKESDGGGREWTAMDVLTSFAEKNGWITAKAGRPDVNRAGNYSESVPVSVSSIEILFDL